MTHTTPLAQERDADARWRISVFISVLLPIVCADNRDSTERKEQ